MEARTQEGTRLGNRYVLSGVLGRGGMAEVYDGFDERLSRRVAVKLLRPELAANPDVRKRFESEARAAARLSHSNVVAVYDTGEDGGVPFIVMERLPGETLADRMKGGPVDVAWLRRVAGDVLQALAAAHARGIVHRDIKPGNILISEEGCAKVADFGIAKSAEPLMPDASVTATNMLVGTPAYLAPERIHGHPATPASDIYAVGVMLYEALAGRKPFIGRTPVAIAQAIHTGQMDRLSDVRPEVDPELVAVIEQAMAADPEERYPSADAMRIALEGDATTAFDSTGYDSTGAIVSAPATTVLDRTMIAPAGFLPPEPAAPAPLVAPAPHKDHRRLGLVLAAALIALVLVVALLSAISPGGGSPGGATATTAPADPLVNDLRSVAARLEVGDGPTAVTVAGQLRSIADMRAKGDNDGAAKLATETLATAAAAGRDGRLGVTATNDSVAVLSRVPGVDTSVTTTTTAAPTTTTAAPVVDIQVGGRAEKKKGKKD